MGELTSHGGGTIVGCATKSHFVLKRTARSATNPHFV
jgi:hypothetical protein